MDDIKSKISVALNKKMTKVLSDNKLTRSELKEVGESGVDKIKDFVSKGLSPIKGRKRFPAYENPDNYPIPQRKTFTSKRKRPVNLYLSGKFLKQLTYKVGRFSLTPTFKIGFFKTYGKELESGHRTGANGQPVRPIIPIKTESFKPQVLSVMKNVAINKLKRKLE